MSQVFPEEVQKFIFDNYKGLYQKELQELIQKEFGLTFGLNQIQRFKSYRHLDSGIKNQTSKGDPSSRRGKKFSEESREKCRKAHLGVEPWNKMEEFSETTNKNGYTMIKVGNKFIEKHRYLYEKAHGEIQKGHIVIFADGDKTNFNIENLVEIDRRTSAIMAKRKLFTRDAESTKTGVLLAELIQKTHEKEKANENHNR